MYLRSWYTNLTNVLADGVYLFVVKMAWLSSHNVESCQSFCLMYLLTFALTAVPTLYCMTDEPILNCKRLWYC